MYGRAAAAGSACAHASLFASPCQVENVVRLPHNPVPTKMAASRHPPPAAMASPLTTDDAPRMALPNSCAYITSSLAPDVLSAT